MAAQPSAELAGVIEVLDQRGEGEDSAARAADSAASFFLFIASVVLLSYLSALMHVVP